MAERAGSAGPQDPQRAGRHGLDRAWLGPIMGSSPAARADRRVALAAQFRRFGTLYDATFEDRFAEAFRSDLEAAGFGRPNEPTQPGPVIP